MVRTLLSKREDDEFDIEDFRKRSGSTMDHTKRPLMSDRD